MSSSGHSGRRRMRPHIWLITLIGVIVPRRLRPDWREEWRAELRSEEEMLAAWELLDGRARLTLLRHSLGSFWDAIWLQPRRLEDEMFQDLRFGARMLVRNPAFTLIALFTLALGIGANTAVFSLVDAILYRPLAVAGPERLVALYTSAGDGAGYRSLSWSDYNDFRRQQTTFSALAAWARVPVKWRSGDMSEQIGAEIVSGDFFDMLGLEAARGRLLAPEDDRVIGAHAVVVISHRFWRERLGQAADVIGRSLNLNGHDFTIIGVLGEGFSSLVLDWGKQPDLWLPMSMHAQALPQSGSNLLADRDARWLLVTGRLKQGVSLAQAEAELKTIAARIAAAYPQQSYGRTAILLPASEARFWPEYRQEITRFLAIFQSIAALLLAVACCNVANLLLARAEARKQETAVRIALGADRLRLARQSIVESLLVALLAAASGLAIAHSLLRLFALFPLPFRIPLAIEPQLDARVLAFTLFVAIATGLLFGLAPLLRAGRIDLYSALKSGRGTRQDSGRMSLANIFVVAQVALSLVALIGAGLLVRSLTNLRNVDLGFDPERVLLVRFDLDPQRFTPARGRDFYDGLLERVRALPGVEAASLSKNVPVNRLRMKLPPVAAEGAMPEREQDWLNASPDYVSSDYFRALGVALVEGREFDARDAEGGERVVIVNETLARKLWPDRSALGRRMIFAGSREMVTVVGIAPDMKYRELTEAPQPYYYLPANQHYFGEMTLVARAAGDPLSLVSGVRRASSEVDSEAFIGEVSTIEEQIARALAQARLAATLAGLLGIVAMMLAAIGLYSAMAYAVARRTPEIGIRLALGAGGREILKLIIGAGARMAGAGIVVGVAGAMVLTRLMASALYGVSAGDALTFIVAMAVVAVVALLASYLPARRAMRVDPLIALREE